MLEAPDFQSARIVEGLEAVYGLSIADIAFLPIGADVDSAAYRVVTGGGHRYFLKLRRGDVPEATITIPHWLATEGGMELLIPPVAARTTGTLWTRLGVFTGVLYPFVEARSGWEVELSPQQWRALGSGLKALHTSRVPPEWVRTIPREGYSSRWRDCVSVFLDQAAERTHEGPVASDLAGFLREKRSPIRHLVSRAEQLAGVLTRQPPESCLCHGDLHAGNILADWEDRLYVVDWDTLILAPKERDLMFVGGGVGGVWNQEEQIEWFDQGYGPAEVDRVSLAYYRFERIVQDISEICEEIFTGSRSCEEQKVMLGQLAAQFEPGNVVEIAYATDRKLQADR